MKHVLLDTNFILTAVKNKIDFLESISFLGLIPIIPIQVINELKNISDSKKKLKFKEDAKLALKILSKNKTKTIDIKNDYVDNGILDYIKQNKSVIVATMDKELKSKIINQKLIIRAKKRLEIV